MRRYRTVFILALLLIVPLAVAVVAARFLLPSEEPKQAAVTQKPAPEPVEEPKTRKVVAAARELRVGTLLRDEDLTTIDIAVDEIRREHVAMDDAKTVDALRGHVVRQTVAADTPLSRFALVGPGQRGFLAAVLRPGTRAATIRPGESAQHAGLIDPGDRVDVILVARLPLDSGPEQALTSTILEDVRVIAVDRQVGTGAGDGEGGKDVERTKIVTVTLEVSPTQADLLALAEQEGTLFLAIRPLAAAAAAAAAEGRVEAATLRDLLGLPEPELETEAAPPPPPQTVRVIRGSNVSFETFGDEPGKPVEAQPAPQQSLPGVPVPATGRN